MNENRVLDAEIVDRPLSPPPPPQAEPAKAVPLFHAALFQRADAEEFRSRWREIQTAFVDEPQRAVEQADELVASVIQRLTAEFAKERNTLEHGWSQDGSVSTEDLRQALRRYRSFFDRLLSV